jgi:hypothetical protein
MSEENWLWFLSEEQRSTPGYEGFMCFLLLAVIAFAVAIFVLPNLRPRVSSQGKKDDDLVVDVVYINGRAYDRVRGEFLPNGTVVEDGEWKYPDKQLPPKK